MPRRALVTLRRLRQSAVLRAPSRVPTRTRIGLTGALGGSSVEPLVDRRQGIGPTIATGAVTPRIGRRSTTRMRVDVILSRRLGLTSAAVTTNSGGLTQGLRSEMRNLGINKVGKHIASRGKRPLVKTGVLMGKANGNAISSMGKGFALSTSKGGRVTIGCVNCRPVALPTSANGRVLVTVGRDGRTLGRMIMINCNAREGGSLANSMMHIRPLAVPRPIPIVNFGTCGGCLGGGEVHPASRRYTGMGKRMMLAFHISGGNHPIGVGVGGDLYTSTSGRTVHLMRSKPS